LDDHLRAVVQASAVGLSYRGRGQRPLLQRRIGLPRRPAELTLDDLRDLGIRDGSSGGTQVLELLGVLDGQQVPTGGEHLAELDERRTELLEGAAQAGDRKSVV